MQTLDKPVDVKPAWFTQRIAELEAKVKELEHDNHLLGGTALDKEWTEMQPGQFYRRTKTPYLYEETIDFRNSDEKDWFLGVLDLPKKMAGRAFANIIRADEKTNYSSLPPFSKESKIRVIVTVE